MEMKATTTTKDEEEEASFFLGIDLGTSGLRAIVINREGKCISSAESSYSVHSPSDGWSEQNPQDWIDALLIALAELRCAIPYEYARIISLSIAGHMHGSCCLDQAGQIIRPCILWNDTRSQKQAVYLDSLENSRSITGNIVFCGFTAPKLMWMADNEPDLFALVDKVLLPSAYINYFLTGLYVQDKSDSAGTGWLDCGRGEWSSEMLLRTHGMTIDQMPTLHEGTAIIGSIKPNIAVLLELNTNVVITAGAADNAAAAVGVGAISEGQGFVSLGTSGVILVSRAAYSPQPSLAVHTFCHTIPHTWYQMGVMLSCTDSLNWLARITCRSVVDLTSCLDNRDISGPSNVKFYPYLSGERTPHNDSYIRAGFIGIGINTSVVDLCQAVIEGTCYALRDCLESLKSTGANPASLIAIGGGSASTFWLNTLASVLNVPLEIPDVDGEFGCAYGAARLAMVSAFALNCKDIMTKPRIKLVVVPNMSLRTKYEEAYKTFTVGSIDHLHCLQGECP